MLLLGESMISMVTTVLQSDLAHYSVMLFGLLLIFLLQHTYFDSQASHVNEHALRRTARNGISFVYGSYLVSAACLATGVGIKLALKVASYPYIKVSYSMLLSWSVTVAFAAIYIVRAQVCVCAHATHRPA